MLRKREVKDQVFFAGFHCKDCLNWEEDARGGGWCSVVGKSRWPGDNICEFFAQ